MRVLVAVLLVGSLLGACSDDAPGSSAPSPTTVASPEEAEPPGPPELNELEQRIVGALGELGIAGARAELPSANGGASMYALLDGGEVLVSAVPGGPVGDGQVAGERVVGGVAVHSVEYRTGPARDRFACAGATYEVGGAVPSPFPDVDAFLGALLAALGCPA